MVMEWRFSLLFLAFIWGFGSETKAQNVEFAAAASMEVNYSGYVTQLEAQASKDKHQIELGLLYNLSDGYINNSVVGQTIAYRYSVLKSQKWQASTGFSYKRQTPLSSLTLHLINYELGVEFKLTDRLFLSNHVGYGLALESVKRNGAQFSANNVSGLFNIKCGYQF